MKRYQSATFLHELKQFFIELLSARAGFYIQQKK